MITESERENLILTPIGEVEKELIERLTSPIEWLLPVSAKIYSSIPIPQSSYNRHKNQYNSTKILSYLVSQVKGYDKLLGIADVDLYAHGLNFVFGEADTIRGVAVISITRLRNEFYHLQPSPEILFIRTLKEAVHELGHTFGLSHCSNPDCVMYFSNSLYDTDRKGYRFCEICGLKL